MNAFITLISTEEYLPGVIGLKKSLERVGTKYPLYCMLSQRLQNQNHVYNILTAAGIGVINLDQSICDENVFMHNIHFPNWSYTLDKLQVFKLVNFEKVVFLDSDLLILQNIDELFEYKSFAGVCAGKSYPGNESWDGLNSGLMVVEPNLETFEGIFKLVPAVFDEFNDKALPLGDQDIIQRFIKDSWTSDLQLDEGYNVFADYLSYYITNLGYSLGGDAKPIKVIHFIGKYKPWMRPTIRQFFWLCSLLWRNPYYYSALCKYRKVLKIG